MLKILKIDGSLGEGGGQVLRIALSLSALCKIPIEIENIRAGRSKPGLAAQHLKGIEIVREMCEAEVHGAHLGSTRLKFLPGDIRKSQTRSFFADTQTAGCISLLAQIAIPVALFLPSGNKSITIILKGGTNVPMGPHVEYLTEVFKPWLNKFGADFDFTLVKRGYYPKGGGEIHLRISPIRNLKSVNVLDQGTLDSISGWAYAAGTVNIDKAIDRKNVVEREIRQKLKKNRNTSNPVINIEFYNEDRNMVVGSGAGINLLCTTSTQCILGGSGLDTTRKENLTNDAIELVKQVLVPFFQGSCVDDHMQDQIIILMAIAKGCSKILIGTQRLTQHTETAIKIAELMLADRGVSFQIVENYDIASDIPIRILECQGCGLNNAGFEQ